MPPANLLETLQGSMPTMLPDVVRQDQRSPTFEISSWTVEKMSHQGIMNPDGLWLYRGEGRDYNGSKSWSIVLKIFEEPEAETDISNYWNAKREALAMGSGLFANLPPDTIVAPRCYGVEERDGYHWIWMEFIRDHSARKWTINEFSLVARQLGRFNGAYLTGRPLPEFAWLCRDAARDWANSFPPTEDWVWENDYVVQTFPSVLKDRVMRLWDERDRFFDAIDSLPRTFLHGDAQRRNLFIRKQRDGTHEVVAIDWQVCGVGPLGGELSVLVGTGAVLFEFEPSEIALIEAACFENYLAGLREAGWDGEVDVVRLAYCLQFAIRFGPSVPPLLARWTRYRLDHIPGLFGREPERFVYEVAALCEYALDRADEARLLMSKLS